MASPVANPKILYRNSRLLRMVFLQLHRQQRADLFCDVVLQAEGEAVPAHCCILSACSPFFTERLEREMPSQKGHKVVLELRGLKIGPLRKLVDFLYTSEMEVSQEEAQDVLAAARQLQVSELESLQLEGGKLVKKALGRQRLNRKCLQLSGPVSIPEGSQSPPASGVCCLTSHLLVRKQEAGVQQLPFSKGTGNNSNTSLKETVREEPEIKSKDDQHQLPADASAVAEFLPAKGKKRLAGASKDITGHEEPGRLHTGQARSRVKQATAGLQESKKIKLSRPTLSSPPSPMPCTTEDHSVIVSNNISKSIRRLWRKKSPPVKDGARGAEVLHHLHGLSPSVLPKATKGRKRSSSEPAAARVNPPQEAGQVKLGRVKLRKVINGSCWEVVQEVSAAQPVRTADPVCALTEKGSPPQPRYTEQEVAATQPQASSAKLLAANAESSSLAEKTQVGEAGRPVTLVDGDSYQQLTPDQLAVGERYGSPAVVGELEPVLDLLFPDAAAVGESQDTPVPEGALASGPAPGTSNVHLGNAGAEEKHWCSAEGSVCPQFEEEEGSLQGEGGHAAAFKLSEGTPGLMSRVPLLDPVHSCLPLAASQSSNDGVPLGGPAPPQQERLTTPHQLPVLENRAARHAVPLRSDEKNQGGRPSHGEATSGAETKPQAQAVLRSPLQRRLDCKLPSQLVILEEDEIDVGGVEEFFPNYECVRPDSSPVSEHEVDIVN